MIAIRFFKHWSTVVECLSRRLLCILNRNLLKKKVEMDCKIIWEDGVTTSHTLSDKMTAFIWNKFILMMVKQLPFVLDHDVIFAAIDSLSGVIDVFLTCPDQNGKDLRNLFLLFGPWLIHVASSGCGEKSKLLSIALLCRIVFNSEFYRVFSGTIMKISDEQNRGKEMFDISAVDQLVTRFLDVLGKSLSGNVSVATLVAVFCNCTRIFHLQKLKTYNLIPFFMPHIRLILVDTNSQPVLRRASILIVASIISLNSHCSRFPMKAMTPSSRSTSEKSNNDFVDLITNPSLPENCLQLSSKVRHHLISIPNTLISGILIENDPYNVELLLWCIHVLLLHEAEFEVSSFVQIICSSIWQKLDGDKSWNHHVCW